MHSDLREPPNANFHENVTPILLLFFCFACPGMIGTLFASVEKLDNAIAEFAVARADQSYGN